MAAAEQYEAGREHDLVVLGGTVIDVVNRRFQKANVAVDGGKITAISQEALSGRRRIDAAGKMISPGFIDFHSHIDANPYSAECMVRQGGTTTLGGERNLNRKLVLNISENGFLINHGFFVSQSYMLRDAAGVRGMYQEANETEIRLMADLAGRFLEFGACGICFTPEFIQGVSKREMIEIAKVAKDYDSIVTVHIRKDGVEAPEALSEVFELAAATGAKTHILQLMYMAGLREVMPRFLERIDQARASGLDITADSVVYSAHTNCIGTGDFDDGWENSYGGKSYESLVVSSGIHMGETCDERLFRKLRENSPSTLITAFVWDSEAIMMALRKDYVYVSTNAADGPFYPTAGAPEIAGSFPRLIGKFVRQDKELSLMDAIRKITILPARRFRLTEIGSIEVGKNADLVVFDFNTIRDRADFVNRGRPDAPPEGIDYVIVNGDVVVERGQLTENRRSGRFVTVQGAPGRG